MVIRYDTASGSRGLSTRPVTSVSEYEAMVTIPQAVVGYCRLDLSLSTKENSGSYDTASGSRVLSTRS